MHSGIWTLCIDLNDHEFQKLTQYGFPNTNKCFSYLAENSMNVRDEYLPHEEYQIARRPTMSV